MIKHMSTNDKMWTNKVNATPDFNYRPAHLSTIGHMPD
jgi:hypothetical protein